MLSTDQLWQGLMPWHMPGWQFPCWAEMTIHISEQAVCAAESGNHPRSLPPQLGAPGKALATWCMTFPPFQLVLRMPVDPEGKPQDPEGTLLWPGARQPRGSPTKGSSVLSFGAGTIRVRLGRSQNRAPNWSSRWVTSSRHKELTGFKQDQEVTNKSYQSGHSPERQLFILPPSQGGRASASHIPGLRKPPALTQGSHKYPGARKQPACGSNSHPSSLFRGGHNSTISSIHPSFPIQLPTLTCCA